MKQSIVEKTSRFAIWSARLVLLSLPLLIIAAIGQRSGLMEATATYGVIALAFSLAALGVIAAIAGFEAIWREGRKGLGAALAGLLLGLAVLSVPAVGAWMLVSNPRLTDISTDPDDPPYFAMAFADRPADANRISRPGEEEAAIQREAWPDIVPRHYPLDTVAVFGAVAAIVEDRRWTVLDSRPPANSGETGRIEAVAQTLLFGFRQDVVIRVAPDGEGTLVDMRSAARYGAHDLGADAERIRAFFRDLDAALRGMGA